MNGLTDEEVLKSRKKYGSNSISIKNENKFMKLLIESLGDPIIKIMLIALSIRVVFLFSSFNWYETLGILISILLSSLISTLSEYGSNKAFKKLQSEYESITVLVKRNNTLINIKNDDIVVDDIVVLSSGCIVPADGIILSGSIGVDESSINGEAKEVIKKVNDKIYKGSIVYSNEAYMKTTAVGINTVYGSIAKELNEKVPDSPLKLRLKHLAKIISRIGYIGSLLVSISYLFNVFIIQNNFDINLILESLKQPSYIFDNIIYALTLSVTIIIVCVPEGLPMMVALVLSSNMKRMLKSNVLVRRLVGIETCGSLNVLLTDKTGTLTKGKLEVVGLIDSNNNHYNSINELKGPLYDYILEALLYNNESYYVENEIVSGNMTDKSILKFIGNHKKDFEVIDSIKFNSDNKYSYVSLSNKHEYYKGAKEVIMNRCSYYIDPFGNKKRLYNKYELNNNIEYYTKKGYRVLAASTSDALLCFILIKDEIRESSPFVINELKTAGIDTIMITGDDPFTAKSIANELNMLDNNSIVLTHNDLTRMSDEEILYNYKNIKVIARALPSDKSRIACILEKNNLVVGMTGDGINDAPALKKANVGISLGSGSVVAKEASDIVILDDNIKSISSAILYGRTIFKSIRKFIVFQLTMNFCALFLSIVGPFIGIETPVTVMQMLWINMIMDTLAGLAYSFEYPLKRYMKERIIKKEEPILNKYMYSSIILNAIYSSSILILFLKLDIFKKYIRPDNNIYLTAFFSLFVFLSVFNAFNARTTRINIFSGLLKNKVFMFIILLISITQIYIIYFGGSLFRTFGLYPKELLFILILSSTIIPFDILRKIVSKKKI